MAQNERIIHDHHSQFLLCPFHATRHPSQYFSFPNIFAPKFQNTIPHSNIPLLHYFPFQSFILNLIAQMPFLFPFFCLFLLSNLPNVIFGCLWCSVSSSASYEVKKVVENERGNEGGKCHCGALPMREFGEEQLVGGISLRAGERIGRGDYGSIYHAKIVGENDLDLEGCVALKVVGNRRMGRNEAKILGKFAAAKAKRIIRIYGKSEGEEEVKMVLELGSMDLERYWQNLEFGEKKPRKLLQIMLEAALAIDECHEKAIHEDVKAKNFVCFNPTASTESPLPNCFLKLIDFNGSYLLEGKDIDRQIEAPFGFGSVGHRSPEMVNGNGNPKISKKTDIWSLGAMIYKLLFGRNAFENEETELKWRNLKRRNYELGINWKGSNDDDDHYFEKLVELIKECLALDPRERKNAEQISQQIYGILY